MENQVLQSEAAEPKIEDLEYVPDEAPASYSVIVYKTSLLPEQYHNLIFAKWLRTLRSGNPIINRIPANVYYKQYHTFVENLLRKPDSQIRLAVLSDDHDVVLGFSIRREDVLDYIYVNGDYRRKGIASALMPRGITTFSHLTNTAINIWQTGEKYKHLKFNPFV